MKVTPEHLLRAMASIQTQSHLLECMMGAILETHHDKDALKKQFLMGVEWFKEKMSKQNFSKEQIADFDRKAKLMADSLTPLIKEK